MDGQDGQDRNQKRKKTNFRNYETREIHEKGYNPESSTKTELTWMDRIDTMKTKKRDKGTRKPTSEITKHTIKTKKAVSEVSCQTRHKSTILHVSLTPRHDAGQLDFGRIRVFVIFPTHVIENQPII